MQQKLANVADYSLEQLSEKVALGGKFVVYQYAISLVMITLERLSPVYFIEPGEHATKYAKSWSRISLMFGWWGIPWGPIKTLQSLATNRKGGVDVTRDIMLNIKEADLVSGLVDIAAIDTPFHTPNKDEISSLQKGIRLFKQSHIGMGEVYFALYVNSPDPYFMIGMPEAYYTDEHIKELKKALYKYFMRNAHFEFISLSDENGLPEKMMELGLKVE